MDAGNPLAEHRLSVPDPSVTMKPNYRMWADGPFKFSGHLNIHWRGEPRRFDFSKMTDEQAERLEKKGVLTLDWSQTEPIPPPNQALRARNVAQGLK